MYGTTDNWVADGIYDNSGQGVTLRIWADGTIACPTKEQAEQRRAEILTDGGKVGSIIEDWNWYFDCSIQVESYVDSDDDLDFAIGEASKNLPDDFDFYEWSDYKWIY